MSDRADDYKCVSVNKTDDLQWIKYVLADLHQTKKIETPEYYSLYLSLLRLKF